MSLVEHPDQKHEIIIVRRAPHNGDEGHHGGAWKIAFADFMTAMMCFFLVMWLINAANEQTKAAVASYFNPVKLIDRNSSRKGLEDVGDGPNAIGSSSDVPKESRTSEGSEGVSTSGPQSETHSKQTSPTKAFSDENLFSDPYAVLAEIAADTGKRQNISDKGEGGAQDAGPATGASGGENYRDPFAPDFWSSQVASAETAESIAETEAAFAPPPQPEPLPATAEPVTERPADPIPPSEAKAPSVPTPLPGTDQSAPAGIAREAGPSETAREAAQDVRKALEKALGSAAFSDGVSVIAERSQVVISITDQFADGMFEVGSAVPRRELVKAMERIAEVLSQQKGAVTINGHTDGRPFRSETYDNWRLSSARAHSAYYMLVRAGLGEERIRAVAGFADRKLKVADNALDAANRRIEILLETGG